MANNNLWAALEIPVAEIEASIGSSIITAGLDIPAPEISASIVQGSFLVAALDTTVLEVSAIIKSGGVLSAALQLPAAELLGIITHVNQINAAIRVTAPIIVASLRSGEVISGALEAPTPTIIAVIGHQNRIVAAIDVPVADIWGEIRSTVALVPIRKGFAMNLSHFGVTEYNNYPFNSFCDYHGTGIYIGGSEEGIFLLDGDDDAGVKINAAIQTGTEDLWATIIKRLREGWRVGRGGPMSVQLILDEGRLDPVTLNMETVRGTSGEERVKFPRGLKNRFVSFVFRNLDGSDFDLESFRVMVDPITHKKR
jgi:hypothetical protein